MIFPRKVILILKSIGLLTVFSIFWIQIKIETPSNFNSSSPRTFHPFSESDLAKQSFSISPFSNLTQLQDFIVLNNEVQLIHNEKKFGRISPSHLYYRNASSLLNTPSLSSVNDLKTGRKISTYPATEPFIVIVVQVHNRSKYLNGLVNSLRIAKGIENVLLVFSHDLYHEKFNQVIKSIDFCRVS